MKNKLVSIIIPIYNTEKYISSCLESVINQTYDNIEIIIINDGTTDNAGIIAEEYAKNYDFIHVYHQENKGASEARKLGYQKSSGEYLIFVDSDDTIPPYSIEILYNTIEHQQADIVYGGYNRIVDGKIIDSIIPHKKETVTGIEFSKLIISSKCACSCSFCISKRSLWREYIFIAPDNRIPSEDFIITLRLSGEAKKVVFIEDIVYNYNYNPNSLSIGGNLQKQNLWKAFFYLLKDEMEKLHLYVDFEKEYFRLIIYNLSFCMKDIDTTDSWVNEILQANISSLNIKYKILHKLLPYPKLRWFLILSNRKLSRFFKRFYKHSY